MAGGRQLHVGTKSCLGAASYLGHFSVSFARWAKGMPATRPRSSTIPSVSRVRFDVQRLRRLFGRGRRQAASRLREAHQQFALPHLRTERMQELLTRGGGEDKVITERERTVQLPAPSRQLLLGALRLA